jgi:hypothetical protein
MKTHSYCLPLKLVHSALPRLEPKGVKANGVLPRIPTVKAGREEPETPVEALVETPVEVPVKSPVSLQPARTEPVSPSVTENVPKVVVKVVPTPRKRQRKVPEATTAKPASPPKPLKVIRRRRGEEEQKVFETDPRSIPKAMLAGIVKPSKDDLDSHVK